MERTGLAKVLPATFRKRSEGPIFPPHLPVLLCDRVCAHDGDQLALKPDEPILDIVPTEDDLVIEARVSPNDIDAVKPGQTAQVHLTPYHTRYTNLLHGNLRDISADTYTDDKTNTRYYKANIVVDREDVKKVDENIVLSAGMPAEVFIRTGEHTLLTCMIEPFSRSLRHSFREK
jgi:HlyD family secretion protein/epimerase transport system membrane fusion protein